MNRDNVYFTDGKWIVGFYRGRRQAYIAMADTQKDALLIVDLLNDLHAVASKNSGPPRDVYADFSSHAGAPVEVR